MSTTLAATPATSSREPDDVSRAVLPVVMLALFTVVAAVASLNVALPSIARDTHATQTQLSWVIDGYALPFAALLLLGGAVGDRYGRRRALIAGLTVFAVGSAVAMTVHDPRWLIAMRAVLGLGAALVMPATLSTITATFPREQRARAVGAWAGVAGAGAIVGVLSSGLLLEQWSWRAVFGLNVVLAVVAVAATVRVIPESADPEVGRLDFVGALLTVAGLLLAVYSIIEAPTAGWASARTLAGIAAGVVVLAGFIGWELRHANPLLDPRLFGNRGFALGALSITCQFFAFFGFIFVVLQYLQLVRGDSPLVAAVSLVPMAAAIGLGARGLAPRLVGRLGTRVVCVAGLALVAAGLLVLSRVGVASGYGLLLGGLLPLGVGMGLAMTPATAAITDALPAAKQGVGSAMNDLSRELGGALGIAVLGSLLQSTYRAHLHLTGLPAPLADHARSSLALATMLGPDVAHQAQAAYVDGMHTAFLCGAAVIVVAAVAVAVFQRSAGSPR
ncbi:MFS transporter [Pseudofrankia inefficax]|uniref:Major facilitator superfamily MFS_1 n=1 Tax=Pseudofrankia inefficax (strain DSM 45817 / CECT 9037 / DDB 130130 / EuI1c) TaxID=298654 RepID=E3IZN3_PSEI1|nr:MFS transporter [Pseudofrankia inefficax]ADP83951.1 major facilitator superfamily MFS_1 [Pseudofrankia inefficax]